MRFVKFQMIDLNPTCLIEIRCIYNVWIPILDSKNWIFISKKKNKKNIAHLMPNDKFEYNASAFSIITHRSTKYDKGSLVGTFQT